MNARHQSGNAEGGRRKAGGEGRRVNLADCFSQAPFFRFPVSPFFLLSFFLLPIAHCLLPFSKIHADFTFGPLSLSGNVQTQQLFRHPEPDKWSIIQQRNVARLRLEYDWIVEGQAFDRLSVPWIRRAHLVVLYRGVYDSLYDFLPGPRQEVFPYRGVTRRDGKLSDLTQGAAHALRFESVFREAYSDIEFADIPLTLRLGRQMIVWGESDNLRMLDRTNALDTTWHSGGLGMETWDELRIPYWTIKGLYSFGKVGPLIDTFLETYWVPGHWTPSKIGFLPGRSWGLPFTNPFVGSPAGGNFKLLNGTVLGRQGDYDKNPGESSQVGVRVGAMTPQGLSFTLNYLHQRIAQDDGMSTTSLRGRNQCRLGAFNCVSESDVAFQNTLLIGRGVLPAEAYYPYVHTLGISASYADSEHTEAVWRMETIYEFGKPFADKRKPIRILDDHGALTPSGFFGIKKSDAWQAFIGFDRPTWIRPLNRRTTFFLTAQLFWQYIPAGTSRFQGQLAPTDKVRNWEVVGTLAASTVYLKGTLLPLAFIVLDPINHYSAQFSWLVDYYVTPRLIVRLAQSYFFVPGFGGRVDETWGLGGLFRRRDETLMRVTYQF
ncbi:MAG TPA: DUF1302 family protein [Methylomirabilota bacterium]|nr:DUF1302 family protein [Methylomirabilota bacterium]